MTLHADVNCYPKTVRKRLQGGYSTMDLSAIITVSMYVCMPVDQRSGRVLRLDLHYCMLQVNQKLPQKLTKILRTKNNDCLITYVIVFVVLTESKLVRFSGVV